MIESQVQRKKRLWAQQDVRALVRALGVSVDSLRPDASVLPLAAFDNTEYESRTPSEWLPEHVLREAGACADLSTSGATGVGFPDTSVWLGDEKLSEQRTRHDCFVGREG
jgi:hypothetical protein